MKEMNKPTKIGLMALMCFVFISQCIFGYWPLPNNIVPVFPESFQIIWGIGLIISVSIISISYMFGSSFQIPAATAYAKEELYYFFISITVFLTLASTYAIINSALNALTPYDNYIIASKVYLKEFQSKIIGMYVHFQILEFLIGLFSSLNFSASGLANYFITDIVSCITGIGGEAIQSVTTRIANFLQIASISHIDLSVSAAPAAGLGIVATLHTLYVDLIGYTLIILIVMEVVLDFVNQTAWSIFIPLGLSMLCFPIFRRVGITIISLAFIMYFVYPLTLLTGYEIYKRVNYFEESTKYHPAFPIYISSGIMHSTDEAPEAIEVGDETEEIGNLFRRDEKQFPAMTPSSSVDAQRSFYERIGQGISASLGFIGDFLRAGFGAIKGVAYIFWSLFVIVMKIFTFSTNSYDIYNITALEIFNSLSIESLYILIAFVQPLISMIVVISLYRDITSALGGETDLFGLTERL